MTDSSPHVSLSLSTAPSDLHQRYSELECAYTEFQSQSKEIESELEQEIQSQQTTIQQLTQQLSRLQSQSEHSIQESREYASDCERLLCSTRSQLEDLRVSFHSLQQRHRLMEEETEQKEMKLRIALATVESQREKLDELEEKNILLRTEMEESIEAQRKREEKLREEMRGWQQKMRRQIETNQIINNSPTDRFTESFTSPRSYDSSCPSADHCDSPLRRRSSSSYDSSLFPSSR